MAASLSYCSWSKIGTCQQQKLVCRRAHIVLAANLKVDCTLRRQPLNLSCQNAKHYMHTSCQQSCVTQQLKNTQMLQCTDTAVLQLAQESPMHSVLAFRSHSVWTQLAAHHVSRNPPSRNQCKFHDRHRLALAVNISSKSVITHHWASPAYHNSNSVLQTAMKTCTFC